MTYVMLIQTDKQAWIDWLPYICLLFSVFSNIYHFACVWPTALKLGCLTNFDMLFFWFVKFNLF